MKELNLRNITMMAAVAGSFIQVGTLYALSVAAKGRKDPYLRHLQCGTHIRIFQTFHVWLRSVGGFATKNPSLTQTRELEVGGDDHDRARVCERQRTAWN